MRVTNGSQEQSITYYEVVTEALVALKRIADALEKLAGCVDDTGDGTKLPRVRSHEAKL